MNYSLVPESEIKSRIEKLQMQLQKKGIDSALIIQHVDLFYYSGTMQNAMMVIPATGEAILFVKKSLERAKRETMIETLPMPSLKQFPDQLMERGIYLQKMGLELDVLPYGQYARIQKVFAATELVDISPIIRAQRSVKSPYEIELIRQSAKVAYEAILEVPKILKPNMREIDFVAEIEKFVRLRGHIGNMRLRAFNQELFLGMVVSGEAAAKPTGFDGPAGGEGLSPAMPQGAGWKVIRENEPILIDIAVAVNGYIVDQSRIAVIGELEPQLEEAYQVALSIIKETEKNARPGTLWSEHYLHAVKMAEEVGLKDYFMGFKQDQAKFLGHGVGIELDELPVLAKGLDQPLEVGMVIAIEPKFTFPGKGVVGIENTYVVTENGLQALSYAPEEIIRIK
ncbi:M24 family metallopeptidase [Tepidibacillus fermentans]|uniref:Xaa-Pro aminopeptidase n=1 Tax=Tepidibacillus fermentans TaxID=1281767 RepID=A0A4R3KIQ3_9BACI|nr:Xaa-Pro peptidase family protein [Tepidibacillus fermentans]TCS83493.1 Xaa-Pro aminopeptidase [Tepidibacillus fermentans]